MAASKGRGRPQLIDNPPAGFLDFRRLGVRTPSRRFPAWVLALLCFSSAWVIGCGPRTGPGAVEDSLTSGRIKIVCAHEARALIEREIGAFTKLYPQSGFELTGASSNEAIRALFAAECDLAVTTRELDADERAAAVRGELEVEGYGFARDAMVIVVHPSNPLENLALEDLRRVYDGRITRWSELGGRDLPVTPVVPPMTSDIAEYMSREVLGGQPLRAQAIQTEDVGRVATVVAGRADAIGFTSLAGLTP